MLSCINYYKGSPLKEDKFYEEPVKAKPTPQFNARISEALKQDIDEIAIETGKSKPELLDELVRVYQTKRADDEFSDLDLTRFDNLSNPLKESIFNTFVHILDAVNGNLSLLKQEAVQIEDEKKSFLGKEEVYIAEIEMVKSASNEEILTLKKKNEEVVSELHSEIESLKNRLSDVEVKNTELNKEINNVNKMAEQVKVVITENKDLRDSNRVIVETHKSHESNLRSQLKSHSDDLIEAKQKLFRSGFENDSKDKEIDMLKKQILEEKENKGNRESEYKKELLSVLGDLSTVETKYNKALGKLEVLEKSEDRAKLA